MKTFSIFALFLFFAMQNIAQFTDDFADGDFTSNPTWSGNSSDFQVSINELRLNAPPVSATKYLATSSQSINNGIWEFTFKMTVNPSLSNFSRVYLVSNTSNLAGNVNGYFVKIGGGTDEISLYKQSGTSITKIIDGRNSVVNTSLVNTKIKITRSSGGNWQLFSDTTSGFTSYISEGIVTDNTHTQSLFFGVYCKFTSTRSDKFYFDNFVVSGTPAVDVVLPVLDSVNVISNTKLEVVFSEPVNLATAQNLTNYTGNNGIGNPISAIRDAIDFSKVHLTFSSVFPIGIYHNLLVNNVQDIAGNSMISKTKKFIYFIPSTPIYRDVVINEIFADPSPQVGLPEAEFVEIYNRSSTKIFNLSGWEISGSSISQYVLLPGEYVVICANSDLTEFGLISNVVGISSLSLSNSGEDVLLEDNIGGLVDFMHYSVEQFGDLEKKSGGWSLELINPNSTCHNSDNWEPSIHKKGGTLGVKNSVYDTTPDTKPPSILSVFAISNSQIEIKFSETVDTSLLIVSSFSIANGISISSVLVNSNLGNSVILNLSSVLDTGKIYNVFISNLEDCEGNISSPKFDFVLPNIPKTGDLIINEILFNPSTDGKDYVEIYNNSNKYIDLKNWEIGNKKDGTIGNLKKIEENYILKPKDYVVITTDFYSIQNNFTTRDLNKIITVNYLPTFSNDEGMVYWVMPDGNVSDEFTYKEEMHFGLLRDKNGVSLERLDFNRPTNEKTNWHSAAETVGFGTPGVKNSQYNPAILSDNTLAISPDIFSPDNDGFEDVLKISYSLDKTGYIGNLTIYDAKGRLIKSIAKNELLSVKGTFIWDGLTEESAKARIGRYILFFEVFDLEGNVKSVKKTCVLGHKF